MPRSRSRTGSRKRSPRKRSSRTGSRKRSRSAKCPPGHFVRKGYRRSDGVYVKPACVRKRSRYRKRSPRSRKRSGKCPSGYIMRKGYRRKSGVYVKPSCIVDRGKPGKGENILDRPIRRGELGKYGYSGIRSLPAKERRDALSRAQKAYGPTSVYRKLNFLETVNKTTNPEVSRRARQDKIWLARKYDIGEKYT